MLEVMLAGKGPQGVPGNQTIVVGDTQLGYYGTLPYSDFISGSALASSVGITNGILMNDTTDWFKFAYKDKTLFTPKLPIRNSISWGLLNNAGVAQGQTQVTIKGKRYIVRLIRGSLNNPFTGANNSTDDPKTVGSEYNDLIYRVCATNPPSETSPSFATFTQIELGFAGPGNTAIAGGQCLCYETSTPSNGGSGIHARGDATADFAGVYCPPTSQQDQYRGWRPMLELVP